MFALSRKRANSLGALDTQTAENIFDPASGKIQHLQPDQSIVSIKMTLPDVR